MKQEIGLAAGQTHAKIKVTSLPFSAVPGQSRLFLTYIEEPETVSDLYPNRSPLYANPKAYSREVLDRYEIDRTALGNALADTNTAAGASPATLTNIELLRQADTVAVVTGQQAGLFTGPLYSVYKALSAIRYAEELNAKGVKAVPVFWAATEDHDFDEVSVVNVVDRGDQVAAIEYRPHAFVDETPVGSAVLDRGISDVIEGIFDRLPQTEFSTSASALAEQSYCEGVGFGQAFASMLLRLFERYGLVIIDPLNEDLKRLAAPVYPQAIERSDEIVAGIRQRTARLESRGFHAQVLIEDDHVPLFWHDDTGRRNALRKSGPDTLRAKLDGREFTRAELAAIAVDEPARFSPGVMLRPVIQDYLLPTACYFGGAAEVAYFAQNSVVYETLGRPVTPIIHRQSFTVVEPRHARTFEKLGLGFTDLFDGKQAVTLRTSERIHGGDAARTFAEVEEIVNTQLNRLDRLLSDTDPTLAANLATRRRKIIYHIGALRQKALLAAIRRDETACGRIDSLFANLLPNGALQERSLNVLVYLNKFGPGFIDWLYEAVDLEDNGHRIIEL
ncbi:MAG: bacillithiol biosynthesis cysteine-adding enzyme BshC [Pyrinomonadaceae bacterium]|nr:bacillithiol biosynthesis cysteine-adding enzyme BshC [Pyrinomonadaceae bacterium]